MDFFLAKLLGRTVGELRSTMSSIEHSQWTYYLQWEAIERERASKKRR